MFLQNQNARHPHTSHKNIGEMTKNSTTFRAMVDGMRATTQLLEVIGAFATSDEVGVQMNSLVNWALCPCTTDLEQSHQ